MSLEPTSLVSSFRSMNNLCPLCELLCHCFLSQLLACRIMFFRYFEVVISCFVAAPLTACSMRWIVRILFKFKMLVGFFSRVLLFAVRLNRPVIHSRSFAFLCIVFCLKRLLFFSQSNHSFFRLDFDTFRCSLVCSGRSRARIFRFSFECSVVAACRSTGDVWFCCRQSPWHFLTRFLVEKVFVSLQQMHWRNSLRKLELCRVVCSFVSLYLHLYFCRLKAYSEFVCELKRRRFGLVCILCCWQPAACRLFWIC